MNRPVPLPGGQARQFAQRVGNGLFDQRPFGGKGAAQDVIQHFAAIAGMADTKPQPEKIVAAQMSDEVAQAVVTAVTAGLLQPDHARRQIQVIVNHQNRW